MSRYIMINGTFREVSDNELTHAFGRGKERKNHKYVSREWKKNKWIYTYPDEGKHDISKSAKVTSATNTKKTSTSSKPYVSKEYLEEVGYNSKKNDSSTNSSTSKVDSGKNAVGKMTNSSSDYKAESEYNSQKNVYPTNQTNSTNSTKTKEKKKPFFDRLKDKLGVDERDDYKLAKAKYEVAKERYDDASSAADIAREDWYRNGSDYTHEDHVNFRDTLSESSYWRKTVETRGREYMEAKSDYMKTPMGTFLKASEFISDVADDVGYGVRKAVDKTKDAIEDAAFEVEYATSRAIGIKQKKEYDSAKSYLEKTTENLNKAQGTDRYMAEFFKNQAEERYRKAENAYVGTPLHSIERGIEWVANLFKKKSSKKRKQ